MNSAVVAERDVRAQSLPQLLIGVEPLAMDVFALERVKLDLER
jgi:hypothetical protein